MKNVIKFWSLAVIVALIAGFASCSKDEDKKKPSIEGQWKLDKSTPTSTPSLSECELNDTASFRNFIKGGNYQELNSCIADNPIITGTWKKNGNNLTIKSGNNNDTYSIVLTEDKLVMKASISGSEVYNRTYNRVK